MTRLIDATDDGTIVSLDELLINTGVLLIAGFETTTNLITNGVYRLLERPDQLEVYLDDPDIDRTAIDEILRFDPPAQFMRARTIVDDAEIGGAELHPGDAVIPLFAAANRDPDEFDNAEQLDVARAVNRHLSFGVGHHLCVGAEPRPDGGSGRAAPSVRAVPRPRARARPGAGVPPQPAAARLLEAPRHTGVARTPTFGVDNALVSARH